MAMENDVLLTVQVVGAQNEPLAGAMVGLPGIVNPNRLKCACHPLAPCMFQ